MQFSDKIYNQLNIHWKLKTNKLICDDSDVFLQLNIMNL